MSRNIIFITFWISAIVWLALGWIIENIFSVFPLFIFILVLFLNTYRFIKVDNKYLVLSFLSMFIWCLFSIFYYAWINNNVDKMSKLTDNYTMSTMSTYTVKELYKAKNVYSTYILKLDKYWQIYVEDDINILLKTNSKLFPWDIVSIESNLEEIKDFSNSFSYKYFMLEKKIYAQTFSTQINIIWKQERFYILNKIDELKNFFISTIKEIYPQYEWYILWWILFWERNAFPDDLENNFKNSWLSHLVAVSWFNITIMIIFFSFFINFLPFFFRNIAIFIVITLFVILVWPTSAVIRAWIMWVLSYFVLNSWRKPKLLNILLWTVLLIWFYNPLTILYDISFHLSVLAVLGLVYFQDFWDRIFSFVPNFLAFREAISLTMSAMTTTFPILLFVFLSFPTLSPLSNLIVASSVPPAMLFWFLSIIFYHIFQPLWLFLWFIWWFFVKIILFCVNFFWWLNFSIITLPDYNFSIFFMILYYIIILFYIFNYTKKQPLS